MSTLRRVESAEAAGIALVFGWGGAAGRIFSNFGSFGRIDTRPGWTGVEVGDFLIQGMLIPPSRSGGGQLATGAASASIGPPYGIVSLRRVERFALTLTDRSFWRWLPWRCRSRHRSPRVPRGGSAGVPRANR